LEYGIVRSGHGLLLGMEMGTKDVWRLGGTWFTKGMIALALDLVS
jgi:hypothetical protein